MANMKTIVRSLWLGLVIFIGLSGITVFAEYTIHSPEVEEIGNHLSMEGHSEHDLVTCTTKQRYYTEITEMLNEGMTEEEILDHYEAMYGEQGFRQPKRSGFSLLAWTVPFFVLVIGAIALYFIIKNRMRPQVETSIVNFADEEKYDAEDDVIRAIIEEEKKKYF